MPGGDKTGPQGEGPLTGRGLGPCNESDESDKKKKKTKNLGRGLGRRGRGRGRGRGKEIKAMLSDDFI